MPDIKELMPQLGQDQKTAYRAYYQLLQIVTRATAPGEEAKRAEVAKALAAELNANPPSKEGEKEENRDKWIHAAPVRMKIAYLLAYVAGVEEIPALVKAIRNFEVREAARFALDMNPAPEATKALIDAVDGVGPEFRVGVINALAGRKDKEVIGILKKCAGDETDDQVRIAAVEGLAHFADAGNDAIIAQAIESGPRMFRARAQKARVRLAETLHRAGETAAAARIYHAIESSNADDPQKKAAELGLKAESAKARA